MYHDGSRELQERFDTVRLADRLEERIVHDRFSEGDKAFIESVDCFFLATADAEGRPTCSHKGGDPGFVRVVDERTLVFPNYDGNGMYLSWGNAMRNPHVGMLFIDFEQGWRMRVNGTAEISYDDPLLAEYSEAQFLVRVRPTEVFPNCPRYVHRRTLVEHSSFVPRDGCQTPVPDWKRSSLARDVLPAGDPAASPPEIG
jgi:predicted pyridoxine 5'-phosphate oxidase superfamily flavin-nucleotide-binding protein